MKYRITPVKGMLEDLLPSRGFMNRELTIEELWVIGTMMMKSGQLIRFRIKGSKGDIVRMGYPE